MRKLQPVDLVSKVLRGMVRQQDEYISVSVLHEANVHNIVGQDEWIVLKRIYNMTDSERIYWSLAQVAESLGTTTAAIRNTEARAIKRLREPDCFGYFVKNFGSKKVIAGQIEIAFGENQVIMEKHDWLHYEKFSEEDLVGLLECEEKTLEILRRNYVEQPPKTPPFTPAILGLSVRATNALISSGLNSIGKLCANTERYLLKSPRIGKVTVKEIKDALAKHGLSLAK